MQSSNDDDDVPELEDLSEELSKIRQKKQTQTEENTEIQVKVVDDSSSKNISQTKASVTSISTSSQIKPDATKQDDFGSGFKRGFFKKSSNSTTNKTESKASNQCEDLTFIKAKQNEGGKEAVMETFQSDLKSSLPVESTNPLLGNIINKKDEWMNQELLMKISQNPKLLSCFMDPRFGEVIQLMQQDPKACMAKYGSNPEFSSFIREFSALMAEHFNKLAKEKSEQESPILKDPEVSEILNDPKIAPIIYKLQTQGRLEINELENSDYISSRIKKLIEKGVLNIQKEN